MIGLGVLALGLPACIIEGKVGDDPSSEDGGSKDWGESSSTSGAASDGGGLGHSSASATMGGEGSEVTGGPVCGEVEPEVALQLCGVPLVPPEPGGPVLYEGVECEGGESVDVVVGEPSGIYDYGECLCNAMGCGFFTGGTTSTTGGDGDTEAPPDACGPYPQGEQQLICTCETCSAIATNLDADWLDDEADIVSMCECLCGAAGCGDPVWR